MKKIIFFPFIFVLFLGWGFFYFFQIYYPIDSSSTEEIIFEIKKGQGLKEISQNLKEKNLIRFSLPFQIFAFKKGVHSKIQAGYYSLSPSMNVPQILEKFVLGKRVRERITIIEGWTKEDIAKYLEEKGIVSSEEFLEKITAQIWKKDYDFLNDERIKDLEGFLFPDTYFIEKGAGAEEIIRMMLNNFQKKFNQELREEVLRQGKNLFDIVIMASLIEKEVRKKEDKELVSGILWKRLKIKMPLQVDATITYLTKKRTTKVTFEDLKIDSPYNTYKYLGLPPGPICNPGFESILAAIYPKESEYWYYLSTPEGETIFSRTLQEHNLAKAKYLK